MQFVDRPGTYGSSTKGRVSSDADYERAEKANDAILDMADWTDTYGMSESDAATEGAAHNCHEQSILTRDGLRQSGVSAMMLEHGANAHTTVVFHAGGQQLPHGQLPLDMTQWDPDLHISDTWAELPPMPANHFPKAFIDQMNEWTGMGYWVQHEGERMAPNDPRWIAAALNGDKTVSEDGRTN